jgi:glyoxylase-like metal-dependent hydrolase (beta-lactamase superfamily II)
MTIELGGKRFELHWTALSPEDDYFVFYYPGQKVLLAVDLTNARGLPFGELPQASPEKFIEFLDRVDQQFDFDVYLSGHGPPANVYGTRQDLRAYRQYFVDLPNAIRDARTAGHADSSDAMVSAVQAALAPTYGSWANFPGRLAGNIRGVINWWSRGT